MGIEGSFLGGVKVTTFFFFLVCAVGLWVLRLLLAYFTSPG
jgi:hypothetical protein